MNIQEFCDIYAVGPRDRISSEKYFTERGVVEASEDEWISNFESAQFNLGRAGKPLLKELIMKELSELVEIAKRYPEEEWSNISTNKAKLAKYISNK